MKNDLKSLVKELSVPFSFKVLVLHKGVLAKLASERMIFINLYQSVCNTRVQRRPPAAFLLIRAITRGASGTKTFLGLCLTHMQSFIKIGFVLLEKISNKIQTLCNFNKDLHFSLTIQSRFCNWTPKMKIDRFDHLKVCNP